MKKFYVNEEIATSGPGSRSLDRFAIDYTGSRKIVGSREIQLNMRAAFSDLSLFEKSVTILTIIPFTTLSALVTIPIAIVAYTKAIFKLCLLMVAETRIFAQPIAQQPALSNSKCMFILQYCLKRQ